jgi:hypothetical protein
MNLSKSKLLTLSQALGYAVMYAKTESQTAEFVLLKSDIDGVIIRQNEEEHRKKEHDKKSCPFKYCDRNPKCEETCRYNQKPHSDSRARAQINFVEGKKISHKYFSDGEFIKLNSNNEMEDQDGNILDKMDFWLHRGSEQFDDGWYVVE